MTTTEQLVPQLSRISEEEYLRLEEAAKTKHEFRDGMIVDMAGGTADHAGIAGNLMTEVGTRLKGKPCKIYGSDLRVRINETRNYCYPDASIVCGPLEFAHPNRRTTIINPRIMIEVTSPSTEADDRGEKFNNYRQIDSLEEYFLVSQSRPQIEAFYRQADGIWAIGPAMTRLDQAVRFRSIDIEIPLSDIYAGIELLPPKA